MLGVNSAVVILLIVIVLVGLAILAIFALTRGHGRKLLNQDYYRTTKDNDASYQFAILSADKLLDKALKESGITGETMGDRLKQADKLLENINGVWAAHKLRNRIAHEVDGTVNRTVAKKMLRIYKNALKDLGAI